MKKILFALMFVAAAAWADTTAIVVPAPPGGSTDIWTRVVAKYLAQELNKEVVVINNSTVEGRGANEYVATQPADGKTLIVAATGPFLFNKVLFKKLNHDYTSFDIVAPMVRVPLVLSVSHRLGVNDLKEFIAMAKTKPLNCAGSSASGVFTGKHFFNKLDIKDVQFIPFRGSVDMSIQLAAGNLDCAFDTSVSAMSFHKGNRFRIIATSAESPLPDVPDAALFRSVVPGLIFYNWLGVGARVNSTGNEKLFAALRKINQNPAFQAEIKQRGLEVVTPADNGSQWVHQEYQKFESLRLQLKIDKVD